MKKAAFILALAMLLGVAAGCGQSAGEASVQSVSMICGLGSAGMTDRFAGVVSALGETNIKKDDSMTIGEIKVKAGDAVNVGDVLFTYDMSQLEIDLEDAQLSLEELKSQLETQQEEKKQAEDALDETTDDTERRRLLLDIRGYNNEMQKTNRSIAEKNRDIEKLQKNMQNSSVKAEVAGEVKSVNANGSTDSNGNPLPLISIVQTGGYRVKGYVNENNASVLSEGISVIIRSRVSDQTWQGTISSIDWNNPAQSGSNYYDSGSSGSSDTGNSSKYPFYVELSSSDGLLMGQHVYIEPDLGQGAQDANTIHLPAYFINDADSSPWVWAQNSSGKLEKRSVTLGEHDAKLDTYVVTDGLTASDYIAFPDETLKAGMTCVPYDESTFDPDSSSSGMTDGSMTDGSMTDGSMTDGSMTDGGMADGGMADGGMADMSGADNGGDVTAPAADGAVTDAPVEG